MPFHDRLRQAMNYRNISAKELATSSAVPYSTLMKYVKGQLLPGIEAAIALTKTLHVSSDWLWLGQGKIEPITDGLNNDAFIATVKETIKLSRDREFSDEQIGIIAMIIYRNNCSENQKQESLLEDLRIITLSKNHTS